MVIHKKVEQELWLPQDQLLLSLYNDFLSIIPFQSFWACAYIYLKPSFLAHLLLRESARDRQGYLPRQSVVPTLNSCGQEGFQILLGFVDGMTPYSTNFCCVWWFTKRLSKNSDYLKTNSYCHCTMIFSQLSPFKVFGRVLIYILSLLSWPIYCWENQPEIDKDIFLGNL